MRRIIPFIIFFVAVTYLFYSPPPMDKIGKIVKTRSCYQLRLMDLERLSLSPDKMNLTKNATASIQKEREAQKLKSIEGQKSNDFSLAMGQ